MALKLNDIAMGLDETRVSGLVETSQLAPLALKPTFFLQSMVKLP